MDEEIETGHLSSLLTVTRPAAVQADGRVHTPVTARLLACTAQQRLLRRPSSRNAWHLSQPTGRNPHVLDL